MCNDRAWAEVEEDKLASAALLAEQGFATPKTLALFHADRTVEGLHRLARPEDCLAYLREAATYPLFGTAGAFAEALLHARRGGKNYD